MKRNFTSVELLLNSDFIHWVRTGKEDAFLWTDWVNLRPENEKASRIARSVIESIECEEDEDLTEKLSTLWDRIALATDSNSKSTGQSDK